MTGKANGTDKEFIFELYFKYTGAVQNLKPIINIGMIIKNRQNKSNLFIISLMFLTLESKRARTRYLTK
jgi:hypothetical protein